MASIQDAEKRAEREKTVVALSSVLAAVGVTATKLVVGLLTNSLGILAEAAHSGLDLVAAAVTFFAVRISGRPADKKQMYGYGKVENLSALFETFLLFVTCIWIIYEAINRLFFESVEVEISAWSFLVMLLSITVDASRSRALMKAAKKHGSQALEADAIHFQTDIWSSAVVICGLILVTLGKWLESQGMVSAVVIAWLGRADAIAALGVSGIVVYITFELGGRTIAGLLDRAPKGLNDQIFEAVSKIPGLMKVRQIRIRPSGPYTFVDMDLEIRRNASFEEAHQVSVQAKGIVLKMVERADVIIHMDPMVQNRESIIESIHSVAGRNGVNVHSIRIHETQALTSLEMHIEVPETLNLAEAHERVTRVEAQLRAEISSLGDVVTHIEPLGDQESRKPASLADSEMVRKAILSLPECVEGIIDCHSISIFQEEGSISTSFHCSLPQSMRISEAHRLSAQIEKQLRLLVPDLDRVYIHAEPPEQEPETAP